MYYANELLLWYHFCCATDFVVLPHKMKLWVTGCNYLMGLDRSICKDHRGVRP